MVEAARGFRKDPTPSEAVLWGLVRGKQLGARIRRQQPVGPFVVDFFCPEYRLIIEVDGPIHEAQTERDRERQHLLEACGYRVLRLPAAEVETHPQATLQCIRAAMIGPADQDPPSSPTRLPPAERGDMHEEIMGREHFPSTLQS
jgi:very-short-patch-repair endonuclease